ncbi:MAG: molybdopterin cofactor-binding domain-containing protein [Hyphomicrobiaceae bacterium]
MTVQTSRRNFLRGSGALGAALWVGFDARGVLAAGDKQSLVASPFVRIQADNTVVVVAKHFEMGQGTTTGLASLVAEELDADWSQVQVDWAPADAKLYANLLMGAQGTGGSTAIANSFEQYRKAGAAARDLLVRAAAKIWSVAPDSIKVVDGKVSAPGGRSATFGELAKTAAGLTPTKDAMLKSPSQFKIIGKDRLPRKDSDAKTDGSAKFALDFKLPNMAYAVVARAPKFGAVIKGFDASAARKVRGVRDVKQIPRGIVVYADNTWAAIKGRAALKIDWDLSKAETRSTSAIVDEHKKLVRQPGDVAKRLGGDADAALTSAAKTVSAEFVFPFLAHAPMEPMNCVLRYDADGADVWDGCQIPSLVQPTIAGILGLKPEQVKINTMYAGGSFGRRANPTSDYAAEAAMAAKAVEGKWPIKMIWTREDDLAGGYYRPLFVERVEAGIDASGQPVVWKHRLAGKSILIGTFFEKALVKDGIDSTSVEGASTLPYKIPNLNVEVHNTKTPVSVLWWRSVGHTHTAYSTEVVIDMLAEAAGKDPVVFRLGLLGDHPHHAGVLKLAADKAGWGKALPKGWGRGVAVHESFNSFVAQVVDVSTNDDGEIKVENVTCAVDCGIAINPDVIRAQMEGGIGYGLGAVMRNQITLSDGVVEQSNFPDYEPLRITDMPHVEVHIVPSTAAPTGVGEPGTPPIGPALANAIYAATGKRIFTLPMSENGVTFVS